MILNNVNYVPSQDPKRFQIIVKEDTAKLCTRKGWTVREDKGIFWLLISVPSGSKVELPKTEQVVTIDIQPVPWQVGEKSGFKLFVQSLS